ncbi:MAG: DUF1844 domain-containing protein [Endomicrobium sp.]|jgi:hypothetical protein|nr:DUF1844 domain-containing protein [Endomicrobium sp.]
MSNTEKETLNIDSSFLNLVTMLASSVWCYLGKMPNSVSSKTDIDLQNAKVTIDILLMFRTKTIGNLTKKEEEILNSTISNLQINYAEEVAKSKLSTEKNLK